MIALIAAIAREGAIGYQGRMPWDVPEDLKRFKALTWESFLVMGRKTFQSIGKPLPGRTSIIVTSVQEPLWTGPNLPYQVPSIEEALDRARSSLAARRPDFKVFIIGGAGIFQAALPYVEKLYITELDLHVSADTFWTPDYTGFHETERTAGATPGVSFVTWERR